MKMQIKIKGDKGEVDLSYERTLCDNAGDVRQSFITEAVNAYHDLEKKDDQAVSTK